MKQFFADRFGWCVAQTEEEEMEDEAFAMMMQAYQVMLYLVIAFAWIYVLLRGGILLLSGGDAWAAVGDVALVVQFGGWVRSITSLPLSLSLSLSLPLSLSLLSPFASCSC